MSLNRRMKWALAAPGLIALCAAAGSVQAQILPDPTVNGYVAISLADYAVVLQQPGTKYLNGPIQILPATGVATAACTADGFCNYGSGEVSATLGANPEVLLSATPANNGGGDSNLEMTYKVQYDGPTNATVDAIVHAADMINQTGDSAAYALLTVSGVNGVVYEAYNCEASALAAFGCGTNLPNATFANAAVTLVDNTPYTVDMYVQIYSHDAVSVEIDPYFTAPADAGGQFVFSPGVTDFTGAPEPAAWALMLMGFAGLGAALRARRGRQADATACGSASS